MLLSGLAKLQTIKLSVVFRHCWEFGFLTKVSFYLSQSRLATQHRYKSTEVKAALSCFLAKPAEYWLCRRAEMARACTVRLHHSQSPPKQIYLHCLHLINTPCQTQPCSLQPAHAKQDPNLVSLYDSRQIKMTSKAKLDSWTAFRTSLGGWLIGHVYLWHCKALNISLGESQLCSCYSNGLQDRSICLGAR